MEHMWVAGQVGRGATGKRVGLVDCASSIRDKGCRVNQDAQEPPFPSQTANPRPVSAPGPGARGAPSSPSFPPPSPLRLAGRVVLLRRAACCVLRAARCCARLRTVCSPSERAGVLLAPPAPGWLAGSSFFFLLLYPSPRCLPVAALSFSLLSIVNPSPSVHPTDSSLNRQTLFPPLLFFPPRFFMF